MQPGGGGLEERHLTRMHRIHRTNRSALNKDAQDRQDRNDQIILFILSIPVEGVASPVPEHEEVVRQQRELPAQRGEEPGDEPRVSRAAEA